MIYFDSAATSYRRPREVGRAVVNALNTMGNGYRGTHGAALNTARTIHETRELLSEMFNVGGVDRVAFTHNATASLNMAIKGVLSPSDHVITSVLEHNSVLRPLYEMEECGVELYITACDENGCLIYEELESAVKSNTKALVCTHASNLTGNLTDIRRLGRFCKERGVIFIVDASQTAGIIPIDMEKDNIDILCFSGHKGLMGPQGTGAVCVRRGVEVKPLLSGGSGFKTFSKSHPDDMPSRLEAGTLNGHGIAGLNAALKYIKKAGIGSIGKKEQTLAKEFYQKVKELPKIKIYGDFSSFDRAPTVALNLGSTDSNEICSRLEADYGICVRGGFHCAPLMHKALGTENQGAVRFSFSHYNTLTELKTAIDALTELVCEY
ncbi:MAG: aminotransferase class V-fold PLP-dependent enzyme [Oscillospiraceae bacterium]|nr:aminotransferase class V-fold PLP-dependent enzyme [Oscillospiraceae bacterium]